MKPEKLQLKQEVVKEVADKFEKAQSVIVIDYRGLTVEEVSKLRTDCRNAGVEYKVIKNNILKRAADSLNYQDMDDLFKGPTAVAFGFEDAVAPAKILSKFLKDTKKTEIKGGLLEGEVLDANGVERLATLPSKEELIAKMLGSMNAPITNFVGTLTAIPASFVRVLNAIRESKEA